jgi:TatD DNase family protein
MELIDAHAHLTYDDLLTDIDGVLERSVAAGVTGWVTVGTDREHVGKVLDLVSRYDRMWAVVGYHPHYAKDVTDEDLDYLRRVCVGEKVVAIGETGLDFHYNFSEAEKQKEIFRKQLSIAADASLPVVVHTRNAFDETVAILDEFAGRLKGVVIHCYSGDAEQAKMLLGKGYYISFTGIVTFKNAEDARAAVAVVPLDRMMIETDCPYISPAPMRNQRPCEPALLVHTAKRIAEIKGVSVEQLAEAASGASRQFFGL